MRDRGQPNIADDVVAVSPPVGLAGLPHRHGQARADNTIRIVACWSAPSGTQPPTRRRRLFRYVTFDAP